VAIIAREPLLRGFLTDKYSDSTNFEECSDAVKKEIKLYGRNQILLKIGELKKILRKNNFCCMNEMAIKYSLSNPCVTIAIPGINRVKYIESDINSFNLELNQKLLREIDKISDLKKC